MSWFNHFSECPYEQIMFKDLKVGEEFRRGKHTGNHCCYILCVKSGELTYTEKKSKKEHQLFSADNYTVYSKEAKTG